MRIAIVAALLLTGAVVAQAKISINGPQQSGAATNQVVSILSITLPSR
jgi:hypothetical protein